MEEEIVIPKSTDKIRHMIFSESEKDVLKGYFGVIPSIERSYVPAAYKKLSDKSKWAVFILGSYTGLDQIKETDDLQNKLGKGFGASEIIPYRLMRCIKGCKNFFDKDGNEIVFIQEKIEEDFFASIEFIKKIPYLLQMELFKAITEGLSLSENEKLGLDS